MAPARGLWLGAGLVLAALLLSFLQPYDRTTWWLEVFPVFIGAGAIAASHRRFPLSTLLFWIICAHALVLILGGAYSYARVPFGFWLQDVLVLSRNPYDKIGHFMQGVTPALLVRELFLRKGTMARGRMLAFVAICVALAFSACYELIEWATALLLGQGADEFLGTQGDPWDTQSDMFSALLGALSAMILLPRWHNRQLSNKP